MSFSPRLTAIVQFVALAQAEQRHSGAAPTGLNPAPTKARQDGRVTSRMPLFQMNAYPPIKATPAGLAESPWARNGTRPTVGATLISKQASKLQRLQRSEQRINLTIIAGRKGISKLATMRNYLRQRFRNTTRMLVEQDPSLVLPLWSYIVHPKRELLRADAADLSSQIARAFSQLKRSSESKSRQSIPSQRQRTQNRPESNKVPRKQPARPQSDFSVKPSQHSSRKTNLRS